MRVAFGLFCFLMLATAPGLCFADDPAAPAGPTTGPAVATTRPADPMVVYQDPAKRFKVSHPSRWKEQKANKQLTVQFIEQLDNPAAGAANINVVAKTLPGTTTADDVTDAILKALPKQMKDFKLISSQKTTVSGVDARRVEYTATSNGVSLYIVQVYAINGEQMTVLTAGTTKDNWESYRPTIDAIFASFELPTP